MRILVAEDDAVTRKLLESTLGRLGLDVITAADGNAAWTALETLKGKDAPELAVLDWMMPGLEGIQILRRLRTTPGFELLYVILLTSRTDKEDVAYGVAELEVALAHVQRLQGLLPICSYCKKVRNETNYWEQVDSYLTSHSDVQLTHGICPQCMETMMKQLDEAST
jgi:sigma-B regulation protein RsbU (phosphoserine phosphatase)